jgi:tetratricopeptide (TPR) repeat protein
MSPFKLSLLGAAAVLAACARADITINLNAKDGDVISGEFKLVATCVSDSTVTQVEFYLDDNLVNTDSSTPYEHKIDTIVEREGEHKLVVSAYAENGESKSTELTLTVDNKVGLGAAHHTQEGEEALRQRGFDKAMISARVALKADKQYAPAMVVLGRAYLGKGVYDEAQLYLEDALALDETNAFAWDQLAQVHVQRAIAFRASSDDLDQALKDEKEAYVAAIAARRRALQERLKAVGEPTADNLNRRLDLLVQLGDYGQARSILLGLTKTDRTNVPLLNKLIFTELRRGTRVEAKKAFDDLVRKELANGSTYALGAVLALVSGDEALMKERIQQAIKLDRKSLTVQLCHAYVTLERGGTTAGKIAAELVDSGYSDPEIHYYLGRVYYKLQDYERSRREYEAALVQDPMLSDVYVARGLESLARSVQAGGDAERQNKLARNFFEIALAAKPESPGGLVGMALALAYAGDDKEAYKYANGASVVGAESAWVNYVCSAVYAKGGYGDKAQQALDRALKLNPESIVIIAIPRLNDAFSHLMRWGRTPVLVMP